MKHYIVWTSSKGGKDLYTITDNYKLAEWDKKQINEWCKQNGQKARAYITECEDGEPYYHKEIKQKR